MMVVTIVLVTHEHDIAACASRVIEMRDGRVRRDERNEHPTNAAQAIASLPVEEDLVASP